MDITRRLLLCLTVLLVTSSIAGGYRTGDKITKVINHENGNIYFQSEISCAASWCLVNPSWNADQKKMAFSQMLFAKATGSAVTLFWYEYNGDNDVVRTVPTFSKPGSIILE